MSDFAPRPRSHVIDAFTRSPRSQNGTVLQKVKAALMEAEGHTVVVVLHEWSDLPSPRRPVQRTEVVT